MSLRDEIEALVARDNQMTPHHLSLNRVNPDELHPPRVDEERLIKGQMNYQARAVVEEFHSRLEERPRRSLDNVPEQLSDGTDHSEDEVIYVGIIDGRLIQIQSVTFEQEREIVEVWCKGLEPNQLPVYFVNPSLIVSDEEGETEFVDEDGVVERATEDPVAVIEQTLHELMTRGEA